MKSKLLTGNDEHLSRAIAALEGAEKDTTKHAVVVLISESAASDPLDTLELFTINFALEDLVHALRTAAAIVERDVSEEDLTH